jgi:sensor histidine kinase YesM
MLTHGNRLVAPLSEERSILVRFLALQSLRLGPRLQVEWDWDADLDALEAPPLLLQPLVENALKHGIAVQAGPGRMRVGARRQGNGLRLEVRNTGSPPGSPRPGATGLANLKERIQLAYGGRATFRLEREGDWTVAALDLPEGPWTRANR